METKMKSIMQQTEHNTGFYGGTLLAIIYNLINFLSIQTPFFIDLVKTVIFAVIGAIFAGVTNYILKKYFPKIFKK